MFRNKIFIGILAAGIGLGLLAYGGYRGVTGAIGWFAGKSEEFEKLTRPMLIDLADKGWTTTALRKYAAPAFATQLDATPQFPAFDVLRQLGKVSSFGYVTGFRQNSTPTSSTATVTRSLTCEKGTANLQLDYIWGSDRWQLQGFHIAL